MIEIKAIGGYNEVGKNCTAIKVDEQVFLLDLGIHLENYITFTEDEDLVGIRPEQLMQAKAVPDIDLLGDWKEKLQLILPTHAHLDHVGAIPFLANTLNVPVCSTPYTISVLKGVIKEEGIKLNHPLRSYEMNSSFVHNDMKIEFIHTTHSTPHTAMIALHTNKGIIVYANDFKFDDTPTLGEPPNYQRLQELGAQGVHCLITDSTYAAQNIHMPSELVAKEKLIKVLTQPENEGKALLVSTFSSHIARLQSIIECGKKINRKIIFMGRSLHKYVMAAENIGLVKFSQDVELVRYTNQIKRRLKQIQDEKEKYLLVVTGHQGEPQSTLGKLAEGKVQFSFDPEDHVVFSCKTIPTPTNIENRKRVETQLKDKQVRLSLDVHESGHAAGKDLQKLITILKPDHIIPAHGGTEMRGALAQRAEELGYKTGKNVHLLSDGEQITL